MSYDFLDIDVLVDGAGGVPRVRVLDSPIGQVASQQFKVPFGDLELENFILRVGRPRSNRSALALPGAAGRALAEAKDVGGKLLTSLFPGSAAGCLTASLATANAAGKGLRVRLRFTDCPDVAQYPWEFLYDATVDRFLCLSARTPVVRYLELPEPPRPLPIESPLRILTVVSKPVDVPELDVEREWTNLGRAMQRVIGEGLVELQRLPSATMQDLGQHLRTGDYHVLHFIGHGGFDESGNQGVLVFEDASGRSRLVSGDELGAHLHDHRSLGLVLLNSCEGARGGGADPFSGMAQTLVQQGVGAVVAMQFEISDDAAIAFSQTFYESLAVGRPVDAAVAEGRKSVLSLPNPLEWATPVLYLRADDGRIFDVSLKASVEPPPELPDDRRPEPPEPPGPPPTPWWRRPAAIVAAALVVLLAVVGVAAAIGGGGDGDDPRVVTARVVVPGDRTWTDSGVEIRPGDSFEIRATGTIRHDAGNPTTRVGPAGAGSGVDPDLNTPGVGVLVFPPGHGGLIARIGDGGEVFGLGPEFGDSRDANGSLQLGINDFGGGDHTQGVANNDGAFTVEITVRRN